MYHARWHNTKFNSNRELNSSKQLLSAYARCCTKSYTSLILTTTLQDRFYYSHFRDEKTKWSEKIKALTYGRDSQNSNRHYKPSTWINYKT